MKTEAQKSAVKVGAALLVGAVVIHFLPQVSNDARQNLVSGGLLSGFVALAGFLASARAFLIVELHRHVYGTDDYQKRVRDREGGNPSDVKIMKPLQCLDDRIGYCLYACAGSIGLIWIALIFGGTCAGVWLTDLALSSILIVLFKFCATIKSMNRNFQAIIVEWEHAARPKSITPRD